MVKVDRGDVGAHALVVVLARGAGHFGSDVVVLVLFVSRCYVVVLSSKSFRPGGLIGLFPGAFESYHQGQPERFGTAGNVCGVGAAVVLRCLLTRGFNELDACILKPVRNCSFYSIRRNHVPTGSCGAPPRLPGRLLARGQEILFGFLSQHLLVAVC